jgi:ribonuclease T1
MRGRKVSPVMMLAALVAVAISAWMSRDDAPPARADTQVTAPWTAPQTAPPTPQETAPRTSASDPLEQLVPDVGERAQLVKTLNLIERGGPFPHKQDGTVFGNRERRLPQQPRGYYREYTVRTPGASTRGARRVVRGDGGELYYTRDHYRTFLRIDN